MRVPPLIGLVVAVLLPLAGALPAQAQTRPNILWISSEDNGPHLGAYGDPDARTPTLDALAKRGARFTRAWAAAPVCAPSRTAIITGLLPQTTGGMHMRSGVAIPPAVEMFPALLRRAGYYTSNNVKEDYNHPTAPDVWDESSAAAHWRRRRAGQPFFAVFNLVTTHESQIRKRPHAQVHDPARVSVPPYHPDTPEVRQDWAQYHDKMTEMDAEVAARLRELDADGLADSTIIVYWGDHGVGLPRGKRWLYPAGLDVPLIVYVPERLRALAPQGYAPGAALSQMVSLLDLGPSMLSAAGIRPPATMQGRAFMGTQRAAPRRWLHAGRDRMDERVDLSRAIRDERFLYIRNFRPDRPQGQYLAYMFETPTTQVWKARHDAGTLNAVQEAFWRPKAPEELYDLEADPHAIRNLADDATHRTTRNRLATALRTHLIDTHDLGLLPEAEMHRRRGSRTAYELGQDSTAYPIEAVLTAAAHASSMRADALPALRTGLTDRDAAVRAWSALGIGWRGDAAVRDTVADLRRLLSDDAAVARIFAAEALVRHGVEADRQLGLRALALACDPTNGGHQAAMLALDAVADLGPLATSILPTVTNVPDPTGDIPARESDYVARLRLQLRNSPRQGERQK
ncbi:MAG TPA: sulfatase-like hydrolase/transferase [Luteitalea sp.]|nr:sulfatase-like hydrolase/transferase [Luteitalea sp.]